ncbi:hypothetical protein D049_2429B, partial [Vibrio parahaemolyticus VPTS-2010]
KRFWCRSLSIRWAESSCDQ